MKLKSLKRSVVALALCSTWALAQTVAGSIEGTVMDPAGASIPNAIVTLIDRGQGGIRTEKSDNSGLFRFPNVSPSTYTVTVQANGFKTYTESAIVVDASQFRDLGKLEMALGNLSDTVSVMAEATPIQTVSSEKSRTVDGNTLDDVTLKGRDLFGYMKLVPGVLDTTASRDVTNPGAIGGITINGNTSAKNFTVDGLTDIDTGSNGTLHYEPNMDAIQELRVLTSNYQAEFGRNSGGTITVVTKNGTKEFHGSAAWNHRHEEFNANSWANNHTLTTVNGIPGIATARVPYRYNVEPYSIGGPAYIPKLLNTSKTHLFFFWSQEYTGQFVSGGSQSKYTPTLLERGGNFSQTFNNNGTLVVVTDPTTGTPFPGNIIPSNRINPVGLAMLNYFPLPNFTPTLPSQVNVVNYFEQASATHPRRNDVLRVDGRMTSKINGYFRWINDHDDMTALYQGVSFTGTSPTLKGLSIAPIDHPNPGHGYAGSVVWVISPTLVNEATVGESWNTWSWYVGDKYASEDRGLIPGLPTLFPIPTPANNGSVGVTNGYQNLLPQFSFGSLPNGNLMGYSRNSTSAGAYENFNTIYTVQENLTKIIGQHTLKGGLYWEHNTKIQPAGQSYMGSFSFASGTSNPLINTGDGYANALLGNVASYSQATARTTFNVEYKNVEVYLQDNWKASRRLTLDLGLRVYHQEPQRDQNGTFVNFNPSAYSKSAVGRIYVPFCLNGASSCTGANYVARDPGTGATAPSSNVGNYVPESGSSTTGLQLLGSGGVSQYPYHQSYLAFAPRLGFAYDLMGDGKTAVRGGWGVFYNRLDGNQVYGLSGQAPLVYTDTQTNLSMAQISAQNTGGALNVNTLILAPNAPTSWAQTGNMPWDTVQNASFDIQHSIGNNTVVDVGYNFNWGYNQNLTYNINAIPIGARWPFTPSNLNTAVANTSTPDIFLRTLYPGYSTITSHAFLGHTNYNALQATVSRRLQHGLGWGATYTFSKALGTTAFTPVVPNNEAWNYGRLSTDRRNNLQINYSYEIPNVANKLSFKPLGIITDHWTLSGITSFVSGAPYNPSCSVASGATPDYTGTPDVSARCLVVGNPLSNIPAAGGNGRNYFNPAAFSLPAIATGPNNSIAGPPVLGNLGGGSGDLSLPHTINFDVTMTKNILLGHTEKRVLKLQAQAYNVFNHTEISGIGTGIQFSPTTGAITNASSLGYTNATLPNRILAFTARLQF